MHACIYCQLLQTLKKCLIMKSLKHSINDTIEGKVIDIIYVGEREIHTILTYHYARVYPGPLLIVLCLAPSAKNFDTPDPKRLNFLLKNGTLLRTDDCG